MCSLRLPQGPPTPAKTYDVESPSNLPATFWSLVLTHEGGPPRRVKAVEAVAESGPSIAPLCPQWGTRRIPRSNLPTGTCTHACTLKLAALATFPAHTHTRAHKPLHTPQSAPQEESQDGRGKTTLFCLALFTGDELLPHTTFLHDRPATPQHTHSCTEHSLNTDYVLPPESGVGAHRWVGLTWAPGHMRVLSTHV